MKIRGRTASKKRSAADFLSSPPQQPPAKTSVRSAESPNSFEFKLTSPITTTANAASVAGVSRRRSVTVPVKNLSPLRSKESVSSLLELKEMASFGLDSIKRQTERSHVEIIKEVESSHSRLHKRVKIQTQGCQQVMEEVDKEFKKMSERITESCDAMKVSFTEFIMEAQTTATRVCKTTTPEKVQFLERTIDALRSRYGITSTPV